MGFRHINLSSLPDDWSADYFGNLADFRIGKTPSRGNCDYWDDGCYPWASISDMKPHAILTQTKEQVSQNAFDQVFRGRLVPAGTLLMSFKLTIGRISRLGIDSFHNEAIMSFSPSDGRVDDEFLGYFLSQIDFAKYHDKAIKGNTLNKDKLKSLEIAIPPLDEQKKIAHILSSVRRAIEAQERIIQTTTELKKAIMHKLFTEGLHNEPQKQTEIGPVPESWDVVPLSEVCSFQSGGTPSKQRPDFWEGSIPWASPKDMKRPRLFDVEDHISKEGLDAGSKLAPAGSVFVVMRGMILAKDVPVALAEVPMAINQDMRAVIPGPQLDPEFLLYAMTTFKRNLFVKVGRSAHGTMTLMSNEIDEFKIPLPPVSVQAEIAKAIRTTEGKLELHERVRGTLNHLFRPLMQKLMTGKLRADKV